jgi:hypothetical protein
MWDAGFAYARPTSEPLTGASGFSFSPDTPILPTPVVTDSFGSRRATARTEEWESNPGTSLTDAIWLMQGRTIDTLGRLLPTPAARDGKGRAQPWREGGPGLPDVTPALLPTPVANPENPGAGGELRAALEHGPARRNRTGVDSMGRPNTGRPPRLLPTPHVEMGHESGAARDWGGDLTRAVSSGASTGPPSSDGSESSDDRRLDQLTIEGG